MKSGSGSINKRNQIKWMALLAAVVVLPTVSLLWFMSRAVGNERLVIEQKLTTLYGHKLDEASAAVKQDAAARIERFNRLNDRAVPYGFLRQLVLEENVQGMVLWGQDGTRIYPSPVEVPRSNMSESRLAEAWQLEFIDKEYAAAAGCYGALAPTSDPRALVGQVRCLVELGRWNDAAQIALAQSTPLMAPARLLLLSRLQRADRSEQQVVLANALGRDLFKNDSEALPTEQNLFIAQQLLGRLESLQFNDKDELVVRLTRLANAEELSLAAAALFPVATGPVDKMVSTFINEDRVYVIRHSVPELGEMLIVMSNEGWRSVLAGYRDALVDSGVQYRVLDAQGRLLAGDLGEGIPVVVSAPLPEGLPDGTVELFFADGDMFNKAAGRQITIYVWTGALVILLMLVVGAFAVQAVGRQIRLNKMKNDFIATVSHELKTPLASMRLLVDTLIEGRMRDEEHADEYLRMIARENERLTRMIESFLSFSRMERNKDAFTMTSVSPSGILEAATDSICTQYRANKCKLDIEQAAELPEIYADHDAVVMVLINLLDNACKYTADDKQIRLFVSVDGDEVCFGVQDNGVGMSRRQVRKIFDSFYQVDNSLARAVEGCGLGLSIVRFIINAHKGRIEVHSRLGEGSTFTVRLPICRKNGV